MRRALRDGVALALWQTALLVLWGGASARADASCSVDCDGGGSVSCQVTGTGCSCSADSVGGCTAACTSGAEDFKPCKPKT